MSIEKYKIIDTIDEIDIYILDSILSHELFDYNNATVMLSGIKYLIDDTGNLSKNRISKEVSQYDYYNGNI